MRWCWKDCQNCPQKGKRNSKDLIGYTGHLMYFVLRLKFALSKSVFLALRQENRKSKKEEKTPLGYLNKASTHHIPSQKLACGQRRMRKKEGVEADADADAEEEAAEAEAEAEEAEEAEKEEALATCSQPKRPPKENAS